MAEIGLLAATFHWSLGTLLDLEHADRRFFVELITNASSADGRSDVDP